VERELTDEIRLHVELETEKNVRAGMTPGAARRKALVDFGGIDRFKEQTRDTRPTRPLEDLGRDLRYAVRRLARAPGFSLAVILCLGLGLGATSGVFSFFFGIVLRPLPFPDADRLVVMFESGPGFTRASPSRADFEGWRDEAVSFSGVGAYARTSMTLTSSGEPEILGGAKVSHDLFEILGVHPVRGREFHADDDGSGASPTVILGHGLWQNRLGGGSDVLGAGLLLDGTPHTIVGVMPPGFAFPEDAVFWVPLRTSVTPEAGVLSAALGRLSDGVDLEAARTDMARVAAIMREAFPEANAQREIEVRSLEADFLWGLKTPASLFLLVAAFVLFLATANVANLLLSQSASRTREMVVRASLGASRRRIIRQLMTESLLLAFLGGVVGVVLGILGRNLYLSLLPEAFPYYVRFDLDWPALLLLGAVTLGVGVAFGLAPALRSTRFDPFSALRTGQDGMGMGRLRPALLAVQVGLGLAVLLGAGMAARSLTRLQAVPSGLNSENLLTLQVAMSERYRDDPVSLLGALDEIRERVERLPGVARAAVVSNLPVGGAAAGTSLYPEGTEAPPPGQEPWVINKQVHPGYFEVMGIGLVQGRDFQPDDGSPGTPRRVIVNESFAQRYWPDGDALGKRIKYGGPDSEWPWMEIIGVAHDVRHFGLDRPVEMGIYEPLATFPYWRQHFVVKSSSDPQGLVRAVRDEIAAVDPAAPVYAIRTMETVLYESYWRPIILSRLLWIFAWVAVVLVALGVYGVLALFAAQREHEFGVRIALGADRRMIVKEGLGLAVLPFAVGLVGGLTVAFVGLRSASAFLYGVESLEGSVAGAAVAFMAMVAFLATFIPVHRAALRDPVAVLRSD
jgi:putative ABC transport system permease protein